MSKHNHYTNYSKFNTADAEPALRKAVEAPIMEPLPEEELIPVSEVIDEVVDESFGKVQSEPEPQPLTAIVTANKLNIRKFPGLNAEVLTVVAKDTKLTVDPNYETVEWFKVYTASGLEGYCMKKFIDVK